jgi:hypothetical protein
MTDDLMKRLRDKYASPQDVAEAAGRIEKLESDILEYSNAVANFLLQNEELNCAFNRVIDRWEEQSTRIEKLEGVLKELLSLGSWGTNDLARTIILEALETNDV